MVVCQRNHLGVSYHRPHARARDRHTPDRLDTSNKNSVLRRGRLILVRGAQNQVKAITRFQEPKARYFFRLHKKTLLVRRNTSGQTNPTTFGQKVTFRKNHTLAFITSHYTIRNFSGVSDQTNFVYQIVASLFGHPKVTVITPIQVNHIFTTDSLVCGKIPLGFRNTNHPLAVYFIRFVRLKKPGRTLGKSKNSGDSRDDDHHDEDGIDQIHRIAFSSISHDVHKYE